MSILFWFLNNSATNDNLNLICQILNLLSGRVNYQELFELYEREKKAYIQRCEGQGLVIDPNFVGRTTELFTLTKLLQEDSQYQGTFQNQLSRVYCILNTP